MAAASPCLDPVLAEGLRKQNDTQKAYCLGKHCIQGKAAEKGLVTYANDPDRYP